MTYNEYIQNILDTRGRFGIPKGEYKERHHIIPECKGGPTIEENLIDLYPQEHYDAHKLLFEENPNDWGLACAWHNFHLRKSSNNCSEIEVDREEYAENKKQFSKLQSERFSGEGNPMFGKGYLISGDKNGMWGKKPSEYCISRRREVNSGRHPDFHPNNSGENNPMFGKHHTEESKEKISKARLGKEPWNKGLTKDTNERVKNRGLNSRGKHNHHGDKNPRAKKVKCLETGEIFNCISYAVNWLLTLNEYSIYNEGKIRSKIVNSCNTGKKFLLYTFVFIKN